jgi:hypothetical protein
MRILICLVVLATVSLVFAQATEVGGNDPSPFRVKAGYARLGDFGGSFTAAAEYALPEWLFTLGWANVTDVGLTSVATGPLTFNGNYYFIEADYIYRPPHNPLIYVGGGPGWYDLSGHFTAVSGAVSSSSESSLGLNVVAGVESDSRRWFGELRWVFGTSHWDWNSDGLRAYAGFRF